MANKEVERKEGGKKQKKKTLGEKGGWKGGKGSGPKNGCNTWELVSASEKNARTYNKQDTMRLYTKMSHGEIFIKSQTPPAERR